jgi:hypothetical protein
MTGALDGLRVIDLTRYIPGPYATMLLGDLGADVVKIEEPPIGDPTRAVQPVAGDDSAVHASLNRNKRSMLVDLRHEHGAGLVRKLAATADVFVEGFRPARWLGAGSVRTSCCGATRASSTARSRAMARTRRSRRDPATTSTTWRAAACWRRRARRGRPSRRSPT